LTVGAGNSKSYNAITVEWPCQSIGNGTDGGVKVLVGKMKVLCNGVVTVKATMASEAGVFHGGLWLKKNADAFQKIITAPAGGYQQLSYDLDVAYGDLLEFDISGHESGELVSIIDWIVVSYDIKNLAESGAFVEV
jgi:hypothetical protein